MIDDNHYHLVVESLFLEELVNQLVVVTFVGKVVVVVVTFVGTVEIVVVTFGVFVEFVELVEFVVEFFVEIVEIVDVGAVVVEFRL